MRFKSDFKILGAYPHVGAFKNDNDEVVEYDTNKFFVETPLSRGKGTNTVEYKYGLSADFDKIFDVDLPATATIELEQTTSGNGKPSFEIVSIEFKKSIVK